MARASSLLALILAAGCGERIKVPDDLNAITSDARPSKRAEVQAAAHPATNTILMFGGNDGPIVAQRPQAVYRDDTWIFEPGTGWTELQLDEHPRKRGRYAMATDEVNDRALLFGGRFRAEGESGDYTLFNDLWAFDFEARTWTLLDDGEGAGKPEPRYYANAAWDDTSETLYVWGGNLNADPLIFDVTMELWTWHDGTWTKQKTGGNKPSSRTFLGTTYDASRKRMVLFGGQVGDLSTLAYNDSYALSLETFDWERLHNGEREPVPATRMHTKLAWDAKRDRYVLFGGHTDVGDQNDVWAQDPTSGDWSEVRMADAFTGNPLGCMDNPAEVPADYVEMDLTAPERRQLGLFALMHDSLWIFGGMHSECSDYLDDTWRFDLEAGAWHELIPAQSGEACLRRGDDCECLCL